MGLIISVKRKGKSSLLIYTEELSFGPFELLTGSILQLSSSLSDPLHKLSISHKLVQQA